MKKVVLGMILLNQLVSGMDLPTSSGQEQQSDPLVSVVNTRGTTVAQLSINDLQNMIRDSVKMAVIANTQEFRGAVNEVSSQLNKVLNQRINFQAMNFRTALERKEEDHQHEMEMLKAKLVKKEKSSELRGILLKIDVNDRTPIIERAANIQQLDFLERHDKTETIYKRCLVFNELIGRKDLGVTATQEDLNAVRSYVENTTLSDTAKTVGRLAGTNRPTATSSYSVFAISYPGPIIAKSSIIPADVVSLRSGHSHLVPVIIDNDILSIGSFSIKVNEYVRQLSIYDKAEAVPFPTEKFNRLVDNVNRFFTEGLL